MTKDKREPMHLPGIGEAQIDLLERLSNAVASQVMKAKFARLCLNRSPRMPMK